MAAGIIFSAWWVPLLLFVGFEVLEAMLRRLPTNGGGLFEYESWPNIVADVVVGMAAFMLWRLVCHTRPVWF
ncbi:MAG: hypothetical protein ACYDBQ_09140 [Thermoplasmatota archaeon]